MIITENFNVTVETRINDILETDRNNFNIPTKNAMINKVVFYYLEFELDRMKKEVDKNLKKYNINIEAKNIIEFMYDLRKNEGNKEKNEIKLNFRLNKDTFEKFQSYLIDFEEEKINISKFFREIFEWYCTKKQYEREKILYKDKIENIENQLSEKNSEKRTLIVEIKTLGNNPVEMVPLGIVTSKNENYSYLLGYSEIKNNSSEEITEKFAIFPTRISNIKKLTLGKKYEIKEDAVIKEESLYLVKKSIQRKANEMIKNKIVSYGYSGEIKLALTKRGKELLEIILHNRPFRLDKAKIEEGGAKVEKIETSNEEKYIYTFNSTYFAVKTYFLSFGKECTILEPQKLKEEFKEEYIKALKNYE